ncbi:MAG: GlxA family transcriptional regulator [Pseudomonadota bacterium]
MATVDRPTHIAFVLLNEFTHLAFSCAIEPLRIANHVSARPLYRWTLLSEDGARAVCSNGSVTLVDGGLGPLERADHLFVVSGLNVPDYVTADLLHFLRRERAHGTRIGAICSGAYVLAKAGFLEGHDAALHWAWHELFEEEFPTVGLRKSVFVADDAFLTASGGTAAADMMLHLIAKEHGRDLAIGTSDQMVYNSVREGAAQQRLSLQSRHGIRSAHLVRAMRMIEDSLEIPLSPSEIAEDIGISTRQLERLFGKYLRTSPKRFIMDMRLQKARALIQQTDNPVSDIAMACGFSSTSHFSKVYSAQFGFSPLRHRRLFD